ncbi:hypothetical protein QNI19_31975 [Cytophagaceae bacterium DM2B3-1]|uniref:Conjugative transposon TraJ C-terminal domain-containing protein n=1 Tax=Xanthocytophaga flava TaxID=3048013 RepID=A0ABT7CVR3_9BACT|nr:hypothetical protein [Xanthocytophaga flavus]MDJ1497601.1 hypothetical protein [Xanthocytophaga flavus]
METYVALQKMIAELYNDMIPLAGRLISVGQGLAGLAGIIYIFYKLWPVIAGKEPLDIFPLLRPFGIFLLLLFYMGFVNVLNEVLQPIADATGQLVSSQNENMIKLLERKQQLVKLQHESAQATKEDQEKEGLLSSIASEINALIPTFESVETYIQRAMATVLEYLFYAASLIISVIRCFFLIILVIIGPISIGFSLIPGFEGTISSWLARYIQIWMWAPVGSILGAILSKIQGLMISKSIERLQTDSAYDGTDLGYITFLLIGIAAYFTIPTVATWVIESSGVGRALGAQNSVGIKAGKIMTGTTGALAGRAARVLRPA